MTLSRIIKTPEDAASICALLAARKPPYTVAVADGVKRTNPQNKLSHGWYAEAAQQLGDDDSESKRAYCKLHIGVPILRNENEVFKEKYDRLIKPHDYAEKLEMMKEPFAFPVTSVMTTKQKTAYLDAVFQHFTAQGVMLTVPEDKQ